MKTADIVYLERLGKREKMADICQRNQERQDKVPNEKTTENGSLQRSEEQR